MSFANNLFISLSIIFIFALIFLRTIFLAIIELPEIAFVYCLLPIIFLTPVALTQKKVRGESLILTWGFLFGIIHSVSNIILGNSSISMVISNLSSVTFFLIYPIIVFNNLNLFSKKIKMAFDFFGVVAIFLGFFCFCLLPRDPSSSWFWSMPFDGFSAKSIFDSWERLYPTISKGRKLGFIIVKLEVTANVIALYTLHYLIRFIDYLKKKEVISWRALLLFGFGTITVIASSSITIALSLLLFSSLLIKQEFGGKKLAFLLIVGGGFLLIVPNPIKSRIMIYLKNPEILTPFFNVPIGSCLKVNLLLNFPTISNSTVCSLKELHSFTQMNRWGILPTFGWYYLFLIIPCKTYFNIKKNLNSYDAGELKKYYLPLLMFVFSGALHYESAQAWGANYLFVILIGIILSEYNLKLKKK